MFQMSQLYCCYLGSRGSQNSWTTLSIQCEFKWKQQSQPIMCVRFVVVRRLQCCCVTFLVDQQTRPTWTEWTGSQLRHNPNLCSERADQPCVQCLKGERKLNDHDRKRWTHGHVEVCPQNGQKINKNKTYPENVYYNMLYLHNDRQLKSTWSQNQSGLQGTKQI